MFGEKKLLAIKVSMINLATSSHTVTSTMQSESRILSSHVPDHARDFPPRQQFALSRVKVK